VKVVVLGNAAALHTRRWARGLAAAGATVRVVSLEDPAEDPAFARERAHEPALDVHVVPTPPLPRALRYPAARARVAAAIDAFAPDVVEAHFVPNYGLLGALVGRRPLVVFAWGSDLLRSPARSPLHAARARFVLARADRVVVDAAVLVAPARALGADPEHLDVRPWGADLARFPLAPFVAAPHVVSLRQLEPVYDVATLVEALPAVRRAVPGLVVTIAGDGPERPRLEARVRALGLADVVRFAGRVAHDALPALLATAAVCVSTARSDSTSVSLLEAMAAGATPVVTDLPGNREWIADGAEGRLFPPGDAARLAALLVETLGDPAFRVRARAAARTTVETRGDFAHAVRDTLAAHRALVAARAAA